MDGKKPDELRELRIEVELLYIVVGVLIGIVIWLVLQTNDIHARIDRIYDGLSEMAGSINNLYFYIRCILQLL